MKPNSAKGNSGKTRAAEDSTPNAARLPDRAVLEKIAKRAHYLATQMIHQANHRDDKQKGDPKVGGHASASASALHIMSALHLVVRSGFDHIANKPHASPTDHALQYLLDLFVNEDLTRMSLADCNQAMLGLRRFSQHGEPVFQSYHSAFDPDHNNFFPSGTVGIPPVNAGYMALAYRFAREHGFEVPLAHFWAICGDSEFREGSMYEAVPDFAERELGNVTWIVDYNRQSLDGHRISNRQIMGGTDADRIERTMSANGWHVIQVRHGRKRLELFQRPGGDAFRNFLENELEDFEFQALLLVKDMAALKKGIAKEHPTMKKFLDNVSEEDLYLALRDLGGHDILELAAAMQATKQETRKPSLIVAHTLKGWGLKMAAAPGNHSALPNEEEVNELRRAQGLSDDTLFARFTSGPEAQFLKERGDKLLQDFRQQAAIKEKNTKFFSSKLQAHGALPESLEINTKMASYPHTQWMLGQLTAKLTRIANTSEAPGEKPLPANEKPWKLPGELLITMAPDVGTSTNLNPAMDGKIFGAPVVSDFETELGVKDEKLPDLVPGEEVSDRYLRFEIAEGNVMSCVGSFGRLRDVLGIPIMPMMTVYDFFIKRAHDQYFYNLYWKSSFICVGTPAGVTLSPEGAQHGWKSDFQIPNQITWEPLFCQELDWILCESFRRHLEYDNAGRSGVLIRGVTRGIEQKDFLGNLRKQWRFKQNPPTLLSATGFDMPGATDESSVAVVDDQSILQKIRADVLRGAYYLVDYRGYAGYEPGDNVVNLFAMGSLATEALIASESLLAKGIYANVIVVTSPDLLCGILAHESNYSWLREGLMINGNLQIQPTAVNESQELVSLAGRRVPIVSVHDGEAGLLDNLGSIVGVRHESLAVRKHSKCGRPQDVYQYHHLDAASIVESVGKVLSETALENVQVSPRVLQETAQSAEAGTTNRPTHWSELWPIRPQNRH